MKQLYLLGLLAVASGAYAQDKAAEQAKVEQFVQSLHFRGGDVAVPAAHATLHLGQGFRYLDQADARRVLEEFWGNPPDESVLGMVVPTAQPLQADNSWAVVVTYVDDGHVSDEDAAKIDYADMLKTLQAEEKDANDERKKAGYDAIHLVGWAAPPRYDASNKKLYWAKELKFDGAQQNTLNYDIRALGRGGYMSLNAVAGMSDLPTVRTGMEQLLPMVEFDAGQRYADYDKSTDKLAGYGLAALIGGGIAAKAGLFAKLGVLLLAGKKFVVLALAGLAAGARKLFGRGKSGGTVS